MSHIIPFSFGKNISNAAQPPRQPMPPAAAQLSGQRRAGWEGG